MSFIPSIQQANFFNWVTTGTGSCILEAVAGSGKTTTIVEGLKLMSGNIFFGAYNKSIVAEIKSKVSEKSGLNISTFHAAGYAMWRKVAPKCKLDANKLRDLYRSTFTDSDYFKLEGAVCNLVSYAKQAAVGVQNHIDDDNIWFDLIDHFNIDTLDKDTLIVDAAKTLLKLSIANDTKIIDFDDMIYSPLIHTVKPTTYDFVLIDEAQDISKSRLLLALVMLKRGGRLIAVGDPRQAIYGFTGADSESINNIATAVDAIKMPLSVSYRCPKAVVKEAQKYVSHIEAHESAIEGKVERFEGDLFSTVNPGDAIISRFNKPLMDLVYGFIAKGVPAKIEGREIGSSMKTLVRRYKSKTFSVLIERLDGYSDREATKLRIKEKESQAVAIEDKVACIKVIVNRVQTMNPKCSDPVEAVVKEIESIFDDSVGAKCVLLTSTHKSKGREWNNVYWLQTGESKWARKSWEKETEINLKYVAITRSRESLYLVNLENK